MESTPEEALRNVQSGRDTIAGQKQLISDMEAKGRDTAPARELLTQYERAQHVFEADLKRAIAKG